MKTAPKQRCPVAVFGCFFNQYTYLVVCIILWTSTFGHAQLNISTSTPTPCYGDVVTLVCHHPELASNPEKYVTAIPQWRENGVGITPAIGSVFDANTAAEPTHTTLTINITLDYFRNKSFNYYCLLVLAGLDGQPDRMETSEEISVNPVDVPPSPVVVQKPNATSDIIKWQLNPKCFTVLVYHILWFPVDSHYQLMSSATTSRTEFTLTNLHSNTSYVVEIIAKTVDKIHTIVRNVSTSFTFVTPACGCSQLNSSEHLIPVSLTTLSSNQFLDTSCQGQYTTIGCLAVTMVTSWLFSTLIIAVLCRKLTGRKRGNVENSTTPPGEGPCVVVEDNPAYVTIEMRDKTAKSQYMNI